MFTVKGFVKFLKLLPVLGVVKTHPRRTKYKEKKKPQICAMCKEEFNLPQQLKYCSKECRVKASTLRRPLTNDYTKERNCIVCENILPYGKSTYCSDECYKEQQYANVRNPFSTHGTGERASVIPYEPVMPTYRVSSEILAQAELYVDCNADIDGAGGIKEDLDELNRIVREESIEQPSRYRKDIRSPRESGKLYWNVKSAENLRRKQEGLPILPSMRHSNLEQQLRNHHEGKKKIISIKEEKYQLKKYNTGFVTITPMRTKSGKLSSEILADVKRKQSMGST